MKKVSIIATFMLVLVMVFGALGVASHAEIEALGYINIFYKTSEDETKCVFKVPVYAGEPVLLSSEQVSDFDSEKDILLNGDTAYGIVISKYDASRDAAYETAGPVDPDAYLSNLTTEDTYNALPSYYNANEYFFEDEIYKETEGAYGSSLSGSVVLPGVKEQYSITFASCNATSEIYTNALSGFKSRVFTYSGESGDYRLAVSTDYKNEGMTLSSGDATEVINTAYKGSYYIEVLSGSTGSVSDVVISLENIDNPDFGSELITFDNNRVYISTMSDTTAYGVSLWRAKHVAQKINISPLNKTFKYSKIKKAKQSFKIKDIDGVGYFYESTKPKYVTVSSSGKVVVKKKTPRGTYKIKVFAVENADYDNENRIVTHYDYTAKTVKVKVK